MQKLLPIILTILYFLDSKFILVKTYTNEGSLGGQQTDLSDYLVNGVNKKPYRRFQSSRKTKAGNDYEEGGADYNVFLRKVLKV